MTKTSERTILAIACVIFFGLGLITAALGPLLAELAQLNHTSLATIGAIFTGIFLGALLAQLVAGPLSDRIGQTPILVGGAFVTGLGILGVSFSRLLPLTLALALLAGLGHGAVDLGANVLIARIFARRSVSALNLLNLFFGVGAFAGPALVSLTLRILGGGLPVLWLGTLLLVLPALVLLRLRIPVQPAGAAASPMRSGTLYRSPLLWALGLILLIYVGVENSMGGWTTTYLQQTVRMAAAQAALVTAGFWLALTAGRLCSAALGTRLSAQQVLMLSLLEAAAGALLFIFSRGVAGASVAAVLLVGFGFGAVYPTVVAITANQFAGNPGKAASVVTAMGSIGGMLLPALQGVLLERMGTLAAALLILTACLLMPLTFGLIQWRTARRSAARTGALASTD